MKAKIFILLLVLIVGRTAAQSIPWSPYLVLTYKYTQPDGFVKTTIVVKKDSLIYQSFEPGKEMNRRIALDSAKQWEIKNLMETRKFLKLNTKAALKNPGANSYTYVMDKFMKKIYEPLYNRRRQSKFDAFNKEFLGIVLPIVFKEEMKSSWH